MINSHSSIVKMGFVLLSTFFSTGCGNSKLDLTRINNGDLIVDWYRESYIGDTRAFVTAKLNGDEKVILNCVDGQITKVVVTEDTITIKFMVESKIYIHVFQR